ncbi:MAG: 3'(2'),5'-bisphosphate nucleotidase CysQ [Bacteroidota bacterium]|jgi:3'(2'), 5'-bisphosphate nucleotidase
MNYRSLLHQAIIASVLAGEEILKVYETDFSVETKPDKTPVTLADKNANDKIIEYLKPFDIQILSEEGNHEDYHIRKNWNSLWIVDPLDGTKEFVKRNGEFTVNIALVENNSPSLGVIYCPVSKDMYFSYKNNGAYKIDGEAFGLLINHIKETSFNSILEVAKKLPIKNLRKNYVVVASRSHMSSETYTHIENLKLHHKVVTIINAGSSIKMCLVAEGVADEYPRFGPTMEWDTAAGQSILQESNCTLIDYLTHEPMIYNRENLLNNWFIAKR